ncbi:MAG: COX15/CtaA family protein [Candidatus Eremiobacteraeota bacterium]|nr:COX15/CtaA family protein [Candidatus Eremiobacteraeota bacterium]MBV9055436.1 COX15/CtaA family protein [Candidatus Eremiobacteraeota bacterium]MBV9699785.1 COX15/CtaA family protein [Candidatus Eremiobacteraeota bacterium]
MKLLRTTALAADVVALMTLVLGSWTRINGAGLTCPDWPLCRGRLIPSLTDGTLWEWAHRLLAFSVAPLLVALIVVGWTQRHRSPLIGPLLGFIVALFFLQVFLGAETVRLANSPTSVVAHWATAMALIAALSATVAVAGAGDAGDALRRRPTEGFNVPTVVLGATAALAFVTMCIGAYVSSSGAGLACLSIPGCAGNVVVYTSGQLVQMVHRAAAAVTLVAAATALAVSWTYPCARRVRLAAGLGVALVSVQIVLGLLNVTLHLPTQLREAHAFNAALVFLVFFLAALFAALDAFVPAGKQPAAESGLGL